MIPTSGGFCIFGKVTHTHHLHALLGILLLLRCVAEIFLPKPPTKKVSVLPSSLSLSPFWPVSYMQSARIHARVRSVVIVDTVPGVILPCGRNDANPAIKGGKRASFACSAWL